MLQQRCSLPARVMQIFTTGCREQSAPLHAATRARRHTTTGSTLLRVTLVYASKTRCPRPHQASIPSAQTRASPALSAPTPTLPSNPRSLPGPASWTTLPHAQSSASQASTTTSAPAGQPPPPRSPAQTASSSVLPPPPPTRSARSARRAWAGACRRRALPARTRCVSCARAVLANLRSVDPDCTEECLSGCTLWPTAGSAWVCEDCSTTEPCALGTRPPSQPTACDECTPCSVPPSLAVFTTGCLWRCPSGHMLIEAGGTSRCEKQEIAYPEAPLPTLVPAPPPPQQCPSGEKLVRVENGVTREGPDPPDVSAPKLLMISHLIYKMLLLPYGEANKVGLSCRGALDPIY